MEQGVETQEQIFGAMEQLLVNFKKDGTDRKTPEYIKRRLDTLDSYWQEYQSNHIKLCGLGNNDHPYFLNNQYEITKSRYNLIKEKFSVYLPTTSIIKPATPFSAPKPQEPNPSRSSVGLVVRLMKCSENNGAT